MDEKKGEKNRIEPYHFWDNRLKVVDIYTGLEKKAVDFEGLSLNR